MDPTAPIPFRLAAAYGLHRSGANPIARTGGRQAPVAPTLMPAASRQPDAAMSDRRGGAARPVDVLVAGSVDSPIASGRGFDAPPSGRGIHRAGPAAGAGAFAMYTRAADRLEVATDLAVGRALDVRA